MFWKNRDLKRKAEFETSSKSGAMTRRKFFARLGLGTVFLSMGGFFTGIVTFVLSKLNFEPKSTVSIGKPEDYQMGEMRVLDAEQLYVFRSETGFQAVSAICTHLGCAYKPFTAPNEVFPEVHAQCPCHGSVFSRDGKVIGGPAPRPLPFFSISYSPDGRMIVDKGVADLTDKLSKESGEGVGHDRYFDLETGEMARGQLPDGSDCIPCRG